MIIIRILIENLNKNQCVYLIIFIKFMIINMNSKKDKFIKFDETIINGKKRIVYKKNSLKSKTLYIKSNNEYKKIKMNGGGLFNFFKKKLGFSVDKIDLFTKDDYDKYNRIYDNKYSQIDDNIYNQINTNNFNRFSFNYQSLYVCNNFFVNFLDENHFEAFKRRFESNPDINKFLDKCDEKLKAFILGLLTFHNFKRINFYSSDELKSFRLLFFLTFIFDDFNYYLNKINISDFKNYFRHKLPDELIDNYWDTDKLKKDDTSLNLLMVKNYDIQNPNYTHNQRIFINLMIRKYSNIGDENITRYEQLIEYS